MDPSISHRLIHVINNCERSQSIQYIYQLFLVDCAIHGTVSILIIFIEIK